VFYLKFKYLFYLIFLTSLGFSQNTPCNHEEYLRLKKINNEKELSEDEIITFSEYDLKCQNFKKYNYMGTVIVEKKESIIRKPSVKTGLTLFAIFIVRYIFTEFFNNPFTY